MKAIYVAMAVACLGGSSWAFDVPNEGGPIGADPNKGHPNIVIVFADDMGYADVGVYGAKGFATPYLDQLAGEGIRFTDFHVAESVCTASRVGLLTGSYPVRVGLGGAIGPRSAKGINPAELLLPELLRDAGYATGGFGKWHLGDQLEFLPLQHGFDEFYGLPYSNDMWPFHPTYKKFPPLPLLEGNRVIKENLLQKDQDLLTKTYTEKAVDFIDRHHETPFFAETAHRIEPKPIISGPCSVVIPRFFSMLKAETQSTRRREFRHFSRRAGLPLG